MQYLRLLSVAAGALAICASSATAQTITAVQSSTPAGAGWYNNNSTVFSGVNQVYGEMIVEFEPPTWTGGNDTIFQSYDWEITLSLTQTVLTINGNQAPTNGLNPFDIDFTFFASDLAPIDLYANSPTLIHNPEGQISIDHIGNNRLRVTALLFEQDFYKQAALDLGLDENALNFMDSGEYVFSYTNGSIEANVVPEPATVGALAVFGLFGAVVLRRRFKKAA